MFLAAISSKVVTRMFCFVGMVSYASIDGKLAAASFWTYFTGIAFTIVIMYCLPGWKAIVEVRTMFHWLSPHSFTVFLLIRVT